MTLITWVLFIKSTPQFHRDPLSSTHRFHTKTTPFQQPKSLSSTGPLTSTHQFHTKEPLLISPQNPSVSHRKPLGSTAKTPQFHPPPSVPQQKLRLFFLVWNWGVCGTEGFGCGTVGFWCWTEGFWCWTEGVLVLNWGGFGVELRGFPCGNEGFWGWKSPFCVELMCWTERDPFINNYTTLGFDLRQQLNLFLRQLLRWSRSNS